MGLLECLSQIVSLLPACSVLFSKFLLIHSGPENNVAPNFILQDLEHEIIW
jgi:hypothetical protein